MHMWVKERGHEQPPCAFHQPLVGFGGERVRLGELGDRPGAHAHVAACVDPRAGIEHVHVAQQQLGGCPRFVREQRCAHAPSSPLLRAASMRPPAGTCAAAASARALEMCRPRRGGAGAAAPASSSYSTAMRTTTPAST